MKKSYQVKEYDNKIVNLISTLIILGIGIFIFINPSEVIKFLSYILGGLLIILAVTKIITYIQLKKNYNINELNNLIPGLIILLIGLVCLFSPSTIEISLRIIFGLWILYSGITKLITAIALNRNNLNIYKLILPSSIILIAGGIVILFYSHLALKIIGLLIVIYAVIDLLNYILLFKYNFEKPKTKTEKEKIRIVTVNKN